MIGQIFHVSELNIFVVHTHVANKNYDMRFMLVSNYSRSDTMCMWNCKYTLQMKLTKKILCPW